MLMDLLRNTRVLPVIVIDDVEQAVPLATALRDAGMPCLEVTLRRAAAMEAIGRIIAEVEGVTVGAGTVTTRAQLVELSKLGASFAVSPGLTPTLLRAAVDLNMPYLPGIITPSELMTGLELGVETFKFFPAGAFNAVSVLRGYADVFPQVTFCPTGGVGPDNVRDHLALPNVVAVGSSWIAPLAQVQARDWEGIATRATQFRASLPPTR